MIVANINKFDFIPVVWFTAGNFKNPKAEDIYHMHVIIKHRDWYSLPEEKRYKGIGTLHRDSKELKVGDSESDAFMEIVKDFFKRFDEIGEEKLLEYHQKEWENRDR